MKLQTSGVLGTSYAIAKLAPKRVGTKQKKTLPCITFLRYFENNSHKISIFVGFVLIFA